MTNLERMKQVNPDKVAKCKLCGKEGYWSQRPGSHGLINFLSHSCTIRNEAKKEKKAKELQAKIDKILHKEELPFTMEDDITSLLFSNGFSYSEGSWLEDTPEERRFGQAYKTMRIKVFSYISDNSKLPSKATMKRFLKEVIKELK